MIMNWLCSSAIIFSQSSGFFCMLTLSNYERKIATFVSLPHICIIYGPEQRDHFCSTISRRKSEIQYDWTPLSNMTTSKIMWSLGIWNIIIGLSGYIFFILGIKPILEVLRTKRIDTLEATTDFQYKHMI